MVDSGSDDDVPYISVMYLLVGHGWAPRAAFDKDWIVFSDTNGRTNELIFVRVIDNKVSRDNVEYIRRILRGLED